MNNQYDETNGTIVGGEFVSWRLLYNGREQGRGYSDSPAEARIAINEKHAELMLSSGFPCYLYQDASKWEGRIYK